MCFGVAYSLNGLKLFLPIIFFPYVTQEQKFVERLIHWSCPPGARSGGNGMASVGEMFRGDTG